MSTDVTNSSTTVTSGVSNITGEPITNTDDYNDFDNPATRGAENINQTLSEFRVNFTILSAIVREYEKLTNVVGDGFDANVDKTNGNHESRVRNLIRSTNNVELKGKFLLEDDNFGKLDDDKSNDIVTDCENVDERLDKPDTIQYNDYNERNMNHQHENYNFKGDKKVHSERSYLIEDILSKYCRENLTVFETNLKKDAYYNTLRSVLKLFVEEIEFSKKNTEPNGLEVNGQEENQSVVPDESADKSKQKCLKNTYRNNENEVLKTQNLCDDLKTQELKTMKPLIHRRNELVVDKHDLSTVQIKLVTKDIDTTVTTDDNDEYGQKNVADIIEDITIQTKNFSQGISENDETLNNELGENLFENSSKNDKIVAEYLLKNKLKEEINRVNSLLDELNTYNTSVKYEHIHVEQNTSLHDLLENLRTKMNVETIQRMRRSETDGKVNIGNTNEVMQYFEEHEAAKKRKKREEQMSRDNHNARQRRSKSEEDYNAREDVKKLQKSGRFKPLKVTGKQLTSKEKYYYPKYHHMTTYDPGDELWKEVKHDYETNPKIRKAIDTSYINEEKFNSHMWNCKRKEYEEGEKRKKRDTKSEDEYFEKEYVRKMKADFKKKVLDDESPETTEGTTMDTRWLDISRSKPVGGHIDINDVNLSRPSEFARKFRKRDLTNMNQDDVFVWYDPADSHFVEDIAQHARRKRRHVQTASDDHNHQNKQKRNVNDGLLMKKIQQALARRRREAERRPALSQENVHVDHLDYDMYHGLKYGVTEVAEENVDLTGMYSRNTAASVGPYQKKRYEEFRKYMLSASSTFKDPFIKVSFAVCPFCGDYFGSHKNLQFHQNYNHFNIFSTVVPVTMEPTVTVSNAVKEKDINDIFEGILKDADLACASEKWADYIDANINPQKREEYKNLLFNESVTAFQTVPVHLEEELTTEYDAAVRVLGYPSEYHLKENFTYPKDLSAKKSIPVVNLYENPEMFMKKLVNHEPLLPDHQEGK